jgi:hypothetical protein
VSVYAGVDPLTRQQIRLRSTVQDERLAQTSASWIVEYHHIASPKPDIHTLSKELFERAGYTVRLAAQTEDNGLLWAWRQ